MVLSGPRSTKAAAAVRAVPTINAPQMVIDEASDETCSWAGSAWVAVL